MLNDPLWSELAPPRAQLLSDCVLEPRLPHFFFVYNVFEAAGEFYIAVDPI